MSQSLLDLESNRKKLALFREALDQLLRTVTIRGFHGEGTIRVRVQDGVLQEVEVEERRKVR